MFRQKFVLLTLSFLLIFAAACNKVSDDSITTGIKAKMFSEPALKNAAVDVASKDGVVTLTGQIPDDAARQAADRIASESKGVTKVIDQMTLMQAPAPQATAAEMAPAPPPAEPARPAPAPSRTAHAKTRAAAPAQAAAPVAAATAAPAHTPSTPAAPPPPQPVTVTVPEGTVLTVRTIDAIDSQTSRPGQNFTASLDAPIVVGDRIVVPKGQDVTLKLVNATSAGKFSGRSELTVSLESFAYQGKTYTVASSDVQEKGASRGKRSAAVIGGGAALGALIGGLAGGGKGAAIGAAVGGGGGTAVQAMTKGQQVKIPAETRLDFTLHAPVDVTYLPGKRPARAPASTTTEPPPASADQPPQS